MRDPEALTGAGGATQGFRIRHRLGAFLDAARAVDRPAIFVIREIPFYALRPLVSLLTRGGSRTPGEVWDHLGRVLPVVGRYRLRSGGQRIYVRHGTPDVFTLAEVIGRPTYRLPPEAQHQLSGAGPAPRVVDVGANIGAFGKAILASLPQSRIRAVEPDPHNLRVLRKNAGDSPGNTWEIVAACAATRDGHMDFLPGRFAESRSPTHQGVSGTTRLPAVDIFPLLADADLVKIDIEGGEWTILEDPRFTTIPARVVVLEYHPWLSPQPDRAGDYATELLACSGFTVGSRAEDQPGFGVLCAWRAR